LAGTILAGVTRQSILDMCREWGEFKVSEAKFTMADVVRASKEGRIREMFGAGTAATVSPIGAIKYQGNASGPLALRAALGGRRVAAWSSPSGAAAGATYTVPLALGKSGVLSQRVWDRLFDIQVRVRLPPLAAALFGSGARMAFFRWACLQYGAVEHPWAPVIA
jgi:branched-chain amino acid aminotransferase